MVCSHTASSTTIERTSAPALDIVSEDDFEAVVVLDFAEVAGPSGLLACLLHFFITGMPVSFTGELSMRFLLRLALKQTAIRSTYTWRLAG